MSLALFRERIEAGEVDETVRAHLRGCDECRALYDSLQLAARALGDDGARAERERLLNALPRAAEAAPRRSFAWLGLVAAMLLALVAVFLLQRREPDVTLRGGGNDTRPPAPFSLRVYGKDAPGLPVHLIADFPNAREAAVPVRAELQYFVRPSPKPGEQLLVESRSSLKTLSAKSATGDDLAPVGAAFPIGAFGPGNVEVCAVLTQSNVESIEAAVKAGAVKYCATLMVTP